MYLNLYRYWIIPEKNQTYLVSLFTDYHFLSLINISLRFAHLDIIPKSLKSHFQLQRHILFSPRNSLVYRTTGKLKLPNYETMMQSHMHFQPKDCLLHVDNVTFARYHDQPQLRCRKNLFRDKPKDKLMSTSSDCLASAFVQGMALVNKKMASFTDVLPTATSVHVDWPMDSLALIT